MEVTLKELTEDENLDKSKVVKLYCLNSQLTELPDISQCINLTNLYCPYILLALVNAAGRINELGISALVNLTHLDCRCNLLTDLSSISALINLTSLGCFSNLLIDLSSISTLTNLTSLNCNNNQLTNLSGISTLINLTDLSCSNNELTDLSDITTLVNLIYLTFRNNRLTALPQSIIAYRRLRFFVFTDNPIEYIPPNIQRFLDRMYNVQTVGDIYSDSQSVHRSSVTNSVKNSIENLLSGKTELSSDQLIEIILGESRLTEDIKGQIIQYIDDKEELVSSMVTFEDVLSKVIPRIIEHAESSELFKILNDQMTEAECMCLTGRISRLVSTLDGFYDDIRIEVSSAEVISSIILQVTAVPGTVEEYKDEATRRLLESGYTMGEIEQWVAAIE